MKQTTKELVWLVAWLEVGTTALCSEPFAKGPYLGQTPPGPVAQVFAPGLICDPQPLQGEAWVSFSADGNVLCFDRLGYVYITENTDQGWTAPQRIESIPYGTSSCCLSPDANSIHFNYSYDPSKGYSHHRCLRTSQGWSWPQELGPPFNSLTGGFSVAADNRIYFVAGRGHFQVAPFVGHTWAPAVSIPVDVEGSLKGCHPGISPDKKYLFFNRSNGWDPRNYTGDIYWVQLKEYLPESHR
jgi:hypothetical protein